MIHSHIDPFFQALMSFWKNGAVAQYVLFNTKAKNATSFFKAQRIMESSWTTIKTEPSFSKFDFKGYV